MMLHYLKVGIRNLLSHKTQSLVSLFGLAMAFACVSLATYWNLYERTYDAFQGNSDRIYRIRQKDVEPQKAYELTPYPLHLYLKNKYPEIEATCAISKDTKSSIENGLRLTQKGYKVSVNDVAYPTEVSLMEITSEALDIFEFEWVEGDKKVMNYGTDKVAISEHLAKNFCKGTSALGQNLETEDGYEYEIAGIYKTRPQHSNIMFDIIKPLKPNTNWNSYCCHTYVLLKSGTDHGHFIQKMQNDTIKEGSLHRPFDVIIPLTAMRYTYPEAEINIRLEDVNLFSTAAVILSLCALLNYLTLFVSRLHTRGRDMALRTICGSSGWQISGLLLTEFLLLLMAALLLGMLFVEISMHFFMKLAMIQIEFSSVMISCGCLMLFSVLLSLLLSVIPIFYFKKKTLRVQMESTPIRLGKNYFRSVGVCVQLVIGILFLFCTTIMMKQVYMLTNMDNIKRKQVAWVSSYPANPNLIQNVLIQYPFIKKTLVVEPLYPIKSQLSCNVFDWDGKSVNDKNIMCERYGVNDEIAQFYGLKMKEGASTFELGENEVFINETLAKKMKMDNPVGKSIKRFGKVKGVIYDYQTQNPSISPNPTLYTVSKPSNKYVVFKYDGDWVACKNKLMEELHIKGVEHISLADGEEYYQGLLKSEYNLLKLLGGITIVSVLIAIFGIYALIMQSCDHHQKEIAIRRVFGAKVVDILLMFFKQYMVQMVTAAVIAFPIGYFLMKNWLEQYVRQTSISIWIYLCVFVGISLLVTLCVGWRVWKAANENPAKVIKIE